MGIRVIIASVAMAFAAVSGLQAREFQTTVRTLPADMAACCRAMEQRVEEIAEEIDALL